METIDQTKDSPGIPCSSCHGTGTVSCVICKGRGRTEGNQPCTTCNGKGAVPCPACNGTGRHTKFQKL